MKILSQIFTLAALFLLFSCGGSKSLTKTDDGLFTLTVVQVNDVYEIAPVSSGREGGMARIATLKKQEEAKNPNTILVMGGDFLSPSVFNSLKYKGQRIRGAQMIAAMDAAGFDYVGFGNHEFDIKEAELQQRLNESEFTWVGSNAFHRGEYAFTPFYKEKKNGMREYVPETVILDMKDADGTAVKIGILSIVLPFNKTDYVVYRDPMEAAKFHYHELAKTCDAVLAITHLAMEEDERLARELPGLAMIIGGHEHDQRYAQIGNVAITKAHANARSAYVNELVINKNNNSLQATETLVELNESVALDVATQTVVDEWMNIAAESYATLGFDATRVIANDDEVYDILETSIRSKPTNFSRLVVKAMEEAVPTAQLAITNSGSMRLDDLLASPITEYDIIRALPYGGHLVEAEINGELLKQVLDAGLKNRTEGGFLQYSESITQHDGTWEYNNQPIADEESFRVAFADFLFAGLEANLGFLTADNENVIQVFPKNDDPMHPQNDIRRAVIQELEKLAK